MMNRLTSMSMSMTTREQLHLLIVKLGMRIVLEEIIKMLDKHTDTNYCVSLRDDLKVALSKYEARYKCNNMVSMYSGSGQHVNSGYTRCVLDLGHEGICKGS